MRRNALAILFSATMLLLLGCQLEIAQIPAKTIEESVASTTTTTIAPIIDEETGEVLVPVIFY